ncbi:MAG: hypothetical protein GX095_05230 [Clostridiales bacterium]|jgi:hypothetical protein|nr:hypothetical protein [Clostridiales bacterium]HOB63565.1 hypothetical protein [Clostridia bacterium]
MKFNHNTKLGTLLKYDEFRAVVVKHLGETSLRHPLMPLIKQLSVKQALEFRYRTAYPPEVMDAMIKELEELNAR